MALLLEGTLQACGTTGGGTNKKTGEVIPLSHKIQIMDINDKGLCELQTLTVPDLAPYKDKVGQRVTVPVRAWAPGASVAFAFIG
jgi:hypothetical protein